MAVEIEVGCGRRPVEPRGIGWRTQGDDGNIRRLEYTVVGDAVNTAARIEALTKDAPYDLLMADATRSKLSVEPTDLVEYATLPIRGRTDPVRL